MKRNRVEQFRIPWAVDAVACLLPLVLFLIFAAPVFQGMIYTEDDLIAQVLPLRAFYQEALQNGDNITWMPGLHFGFYVHGEGHVGMYHPAHWLTYRMLPLDGALNLELFSSYAFSVVGMLALLRRFGLSWAGAGLGASIYTFCGFMVTHYVHLPYATSAAHYPWLILCIDVLLRTASYRPAVWAALGLCALTTSQFLLGQPHLMWWAAIIEISFALYRWPESRRVGRYGLLAGAKVCALLMGAVQWIPSKEMVELSYRSEGSYAFATQHSLHPLNFLQFVSPYVFNRRMYSDISWDAVYIGAVTIVLVVWLGRRIPRLGSMRSLAIASLVMAGIGLVLALGHFTPIYRLVYQLPLIGLFRAPGRHIVITHFSLAIAAAIAFWDLCRVASERSRCGLDTRAFLLAPAVLSLLVALVFTAGFLFPRTALGEFTLREVTSLGNLFIGVGFMAAAGLLVGAAAGGHRLALIAVLVLAGLDISLYSFRHKDRMRLEDIYAQIELPPETEAYRVGTYYQPNFGINTPTMKGVRVEGGHIALIPARRLDYSEINALRVASVGWRKVRYGTWPEAAYQPDRGERWEEVPEPMPHAWLVSEARPSENPADDISTIDPAVTALVDQPVALDGGLGGTVTTLENRPGYLRFGVAASGRQLLVISESHHPGWKAYLDGAPAEVLRANGDFFGAVVSESVREVLFIFDPDSLRYGKQISLAGVVLTAGLGGVLLLWPLYSRRNQGKPRSDA